MNEVAQIVGLKYRIKLVEDGIYGVDIGNNTWNGIIGELINGVSSSRVLYTGTSI